MLVRDIEIRKPKLSVHKAKEYSFLAKVNLEESLFLDLLIQIFDIKEFHKSEAKTSTKHLVNMGETESTANLGQPTFVGR